MHNNEKVQLKIAVSLNKPHNETSYSMNFLGRLLTILKNTYKQVMFSKFASILLLLEIT
jgi:hypothetical protein